MHTLHGKPSSKYEEITVQDTGRLLRGLRKLDFQVEQFIVSSTMLVHRPGEPGEFITEDSPIEATWAYPGALRDMVANHLLQLLTLTAMEPPTAFDADAVRDQKVQVLRAIQPMTFEEVAQRTVRGQYGAGTIDGRPVTGYRKEPGVSKDSVVETFAAIEFHVDNWRRAGVPFYVRTGKRLGRKMTEIRVHFRRPPQALFASAPVAVAEPNLITLRIQPDEGITITFAAKQPGDEVRPLPVEAEFAYAKSFPSELPDAYATLLLDAMRGDATLFARRDEVEAAWRIITPIAESWARISPVLSNYAAGSNGPVEAGILMRARPHHAWCPLEPKANPRKRRSS